MPSRARGPRPPSPKGASARRPSLASRAKAGRPGKTRTSWFCRHQVEGERAAHGQFETATKRCRLDDHFGGRTHGLNISVTVGVKTFHTPQTAIAIPLKLLFSKISTMGCAMNKLAVLSLTTVLTGCGTYLPSLTSREILPLEVLIAKIDCEFQVAVWKQRHLKGRTFLAGWQGVYGVTIKSNETGSTKSLGNVFPFLPAKNLAINGSVGAGETTTANRTGLMKFSLAFDDVKKEPVCARVQTGSLHPFITGRIGFEEWMDRVFEAAEIGGELQLNRPQRISSIGHTFEFSIDVNANAGAGFVIGPPPTIGINAAATIDRLDDGIVDVVIAKPAIDPLPGLITTLTNEERELIAELKKLIEKKQKGIDSRLSELNAPANRSLTSRLSTLDKMTIQRLSPNDEGQQREFGLDRQQLAKLQALKSLQDENQTDEQAIKDLRKEIAGVKPTQVSIVTKPHILPPERNTEIIYTTQQLTLERLNNNLRVVP